MSAEEYRDLFSEVGGQEERQLVHMAIRAVGKEFDAACGPRGVAPIGPSIEAQIKAGEWDF